MEWWLSEAGERHMDSRDRSVVNKMWSCNSLGVGCSVGPLYSEVTICNTRILHLLLKKKS